MRMQKFRNFAVLVGLALTSSPVYAEGEGSAPTAILKALPIGAPVVIPVPPAQPLPSPAPVHVAGKLAERLKAGQHAPWQPRAEVAGEAGFWRPVAAGTEAAGVVFDQVAAGAPGMLWAVSKATKSIYQHNQKHGWKSRGNGVFVAVGCDGTVMSIDEHNKVYVHQPKDQLRPWAEVSGIRLSAISIVDKKTMWGVLAADDGDEVFQCKDGVWAPATNLLGEEAFGVSVISANAAGMVLAVREDGVPLAFDMATKLPVIKAKKGKREKSVRKRVGRAIKKKSKQAVKAVHKTGKAPKEKSQLAE